MKSASALDSKKFSPAVLEWYDCHGRKDLPWQQQITPYRVWISEIMLQQTQVNTVISYFHRFMQRFPDVKTLAQANMDDVLHLWSGLGYYARARNLYKTAVVILQKYNGEFPDNLEALANLPGIGLSTAGAILSLSMNISAAILDGNVKRVLARVCAIDEWPGQLKIIRQLWEIAISLTPQERVANYNQAMMDLGAMICTRSQPKCSACPLMFCCQAYQQKNVSAYPVAKPKKSLPKRQAYFLILQNHANEILLIKRPAVGIWGGLWSLPECSAPQMLNDWSKQNLACQLSDIEVMPDVQHVFSHFQLTLVPIKAKVKKQLPLIMESAEQVWYKKGKQQTIGLPAPIQKILEEVSV
jgi:A/G-specific adenine glycosylase